MKHMPLWDSGPPAEVSPLRHDLKADACVIGLGGSGLSCIHELLSLGLTVAGIDAVGIAAGAAGRNGGFLLAGTAWFDHDAARALGKTRATAIYRQTLDEINRMASLTPEAIRLTGSLRIADDDAELADCDAHFDAMIDAGLPVERYRGPEGTGLLFPRDGVFNPAERCNALANTAIARGAALHAPARATRIERGAVTTERATIHCGMVIVAVDGALSRVLPELAGTVRTARLQMLSTAPAPEVSFPRPVYLRYGYEYWQQLPDRRIALGGFRDRGGEAEWTDNSEPDVVVQDQLEHLLRTRLGVKAAITNRWAAAVSFREAVLPFIGEVRPGVWAIGGYNGTGNVIGALCGRGVARLATNGDRSVLGALID